MLARQALYHLNRALSHFWFLVCVKIKSHANYGQATDRDPPTSTSQVVARSMSVSHMPSLSTFILPGSGPSKLETAMCSCHHEGAGHCCHFFRMLLSWSHQAYTLLLSILLLTNLLLPATPFCSIWAVIQKSDMGQRPSSKDRLQPSPGH
jgi:hypothetical protein